MLEINVYGDELWNEETETFLKPELIATLRMEHSLVSISKWESKWHKSFLSTKDKTDEELIDYMRCMTITQHIDPDLYYNLPANVVDEIMDYINNPMTATTFRETNSRPDNSIITAEIIYYWMVTFNIPAEYQKWHINRLLTLIRVCSTKSQSPKKMSKAELAQRTRSLNAQRRQSLNTPG